MRITSFTSYNAPVFFFFFFFLRVCLVALQLLLLLGLSVDFSI